jgi:spoIIIJ-associated protein
MSEKRTSLEVIAPSVEEAVARGLEDLGLPAEAVDVEILDSGSRGLFGLGSRQARIRLSIRGAAAVESAPAVPVVVAPAASDPQPEIAVALPRKIEAPRTPEQKPARPEAPPPTSIEAASAALMAGDETLDVARVVVNELIAKMRVRATVAAQYGEPDEPGSKPPVRVDIRGDDLNILIGPHSETLNAIQYVSGLIIAKELGHSIPLVVDVEGFRMRREQQIRQLARRMAEQAVRTGRRQSLEPMPAAERRLVHIELRSNTQVTTESQGEEPRRKVTIVPVVQK